MEVPDIECVFQSISGRGSIFISNLPAAQDPALLKSLGIGAVLSAARMGRVNHRKEDVPLYLYIPADDHKDFQLHKFFGQTFEFIEMARKSTNVLVHCMVGVSRSVTIVSAYLIKKYKYSLRDVFNTIQRKRTKINPNEGFIEQLRRYSQQQGIKCDFEENKVPRVSRGKSKRSYKGSKSPGIYATKGNIDTMSNFNTSKNLATPKKHQEEDFGSGIEKSPTLRKGASCSDRNRRNYKSKSPSIQQVKDIMASMTPQLSTLQKTDKLNSKDDEQLPSEMMGKSLVIKKATSCVQPSNVEQAEVQAIRYKGDCTTIESPTRKRNISSIEKKIKLIKEQMERKESKNSKISSFLWSDPTSEKTQKVKDSLKLSIESTSTIAKDQLLMSPGISERRSPKVSILAQRSTPQYTKQMESKQIFSEELKPEIASPLLPTRNISTRTNHLISHRQP